ncbi:hypothetical protein F750_1703 [Streptomyces sp. PAMC 26508]|nr:hypothetical protein F750_1703 [Streptomyces sp. PAMC 26508]
MVADAVRRRRPPGHAHGSSAQRRQSHTTGFRTGTPGRRDTFRRHRRRPMEN